MSINELSSKVRELRELKRMASELEAEITSIEDEIKAHMTEEGTDTLSGTDYKISWKTVKSARFDSTRFKAENPELYKAFAKETESKRFTIV